MHIDDIDCVLALEVEVFTMGKLKYDKKNGVGYHVRRKIVQSGMHVGYRYYTWTGVFNSLHFVGYRWFCKD